MFAIDVRNSGEHADRPCDGSQWITDFVGDGRGQSSYSSEAVLHADFALQTPDFGEVVESVDVSEDAALGHGQRCSAHTQCLAKLRRGVKAHFGMRLLRINVGQRIHEQFVDRSS
jgi:hypothetical protein